MAVQIEETNRGGVVDVKITGDLPYEVEERRDEYLQRYNPLGYGTSFRELAQRGEKFAMFGWRYSKC